MLFIFFFWAVGKNSLRKEIEFKIALAWKPKTWLLLLDFWPVLPIIASVFHIQNKTWKPEMYVKVFWRALKLLYKLKYINKPQNYGSKCSWFYVINKTRASHTCKPETILLFLFSLPQVIEVVIRSEEGLSRDMVKHLNSIEEQILESLAWSHDSALWEALQASANRVPTCEEVS